MPAVPDSPSLPAQALDRRDPEATGRFLEDLFPDPNLRRSLLSILAQSIEEAHRLNPESWSLTLGVRHEYLRLNVGPILALTLRSDKADLILETASGRRDDATFRAVKGVVLRALTLPELVAEWPSLSGSHLRAIARAATKIRKSLYWQSHSPGVLTYMSALLDQPLPRPGHEKPGAGPAKGPQAEEILRLLRVHYPDWNGFEHPAFNRDEIGYKKKTIEKARRDLSESELRRLLGEEQHEELIRRLDALGKDNNLLYRSNPSQGDLNILYQDGLDKQGFCSAMLDLLYGEGDSPERLGRYVAWVKRADLPSKWTFPTYFLFICHPESEIFVKPGTTKAFLGFLGVNDDIRGDVTPAKYARILDLAQSLMGMLAEYEPHDMVDIQSVFWVCGRVLQAPTPPTGPVQPVSTAFLAPGFDLLAQLQEEPTREFYLKHKESLQKFVEEPFQRLFHDVTAILPESIRRVMESEKNLFSRFLKNDYGKGGAWSFYWGALYPKGGNRTRDPQLSLWINHDRLEAGFYIGDYGSEKRALFLRNCSRWRDSLSHLLGNPLSDSRIIFGTSDRYTDLSSGKFTAKTDTSWQDWLRDPTQAGLDASAIYLRDDLLRLDREDLVAEIVELYEKFFPLVLLAISDDPLPEIRKYLGEEERFEQESQPPYSLAQCSAKTGVDEDTLARWVRSIHRKGQAILYGPPGTGKTHLAGELAQHLIGGGDGFCELVQFHPSYSYEEFIQGIRPEQRPEGGLDYPLKKGRFLEFCERAGERKDTCVLIIDEINRANLARVFGELMYLLEYRDRAIPLAAGRQLAIPGNVRILGTMNTADRSTALVDHALRRRFAFIGLSPNFEILDKFHSGNDGSVAPLIELLKRINREIDNPHYEIGITFFLDKDLGRNLEDIWTMEIYPYLEEYFFDQRQKSDSFRWERVRSALGV